MLRRKIARRVEEDCAEQVTGKLQLYAIRAAGGSGDGLVRACRMEATVSCHLGRARPPKLANAVGEVRRRREPKQGRALIFP